jgi:hypothetical protein
MYSADKENIPTWGGVNKFWCSGSKVIMPVHNEYGRANEGCYVMERATAKARALRTGTKAEEIDTGGRKWCAPCWGASLCAPELTTMASVG